jgi:hypothetical protein
MRMTNRFDAVWAHDGSLVRARNPNPPPQNDLGWELDLTLTYHYSERIEFRASFAQFIPGAYLRDTGGAPKTHGSTFEVVLRY